MIFMTVGSTEKPRSVQGHWDRELTGMSKLAFVCEACPTTSRGYSRLPCRRFCGLESAIM